MVINKILSNTISILYYSHYSYLIVILNKSTVYSVHCNNNVQCTMYTVHTTLYGGEISFTETRYLTILLSLDYKLYTIYMFIITFITGYGCNSSCNYRI